jgi:hypothetical protein
MGLFGQFFFVCGLMRLQFLRFQVTPNALIRIELRRVRREVKQLQPRLAGDKGLDPFGGVSTGLIGNHKELPARVFCQQRFEEVDEHRGIDLLGGNREKQSTLQAQGAHDQHIGSLACHANQRRLTHRGPGPAHRGRQANHRLVFEEEQSALLLGQTLDARPLGGEPLGARLGMLFQRTPFRFLTAELEFF